MPYLGNEEGIPLAPMNPLLHPSFFDFEVRIIRELLQVPNALGVRFHFDQHRPNFPTELYVAACDATMDIPTSTGVDYIRSNGQEIAQADLPQNILDSFKKGPKPGACVFFSRALLEENIIGDGSLPSPVDTLRLYVTTYNPPFGSDLVDANGNPYFTLVAAGLLADSSQITTSWLSEHPCPPNCPTDPDDPYGTQA